MDEDKSLTIVFTVFIYAIILLPSDRDFGVLKKYKYATVYIHKRSLQLSVLIPNKSKKVRIIYTYVVNT